MAVNRPDLPIFGESNTALWDHLRRVDPEHAKAFQRAGGFRGTAVKPVWIERRVTELLGPCGVGWGMTKPEYHEIAHEDERLVYCTVGVWYRLPNGERSELIWGEGGDYIVRKNKDGRLMLDDEARKKSYTDALGNALKHLGAAADIHMGLWDDNKYLSENRRYWEDEKKSSTGSQDDSRSGKVERRQRQPTSAPAHDPVTGEVDEPVLYPIVLPTPGGGTGTKRMTLPEIAQRMEKMATENPERAGMIISLNPELFGPDCPGETIGTVVEELMRRKR